MNVNTSKEKKFYTQGQRFVARVLFIVWLLASGSPDSILATPKHQMKPANTNSPQGPALASALPTPLPGGILQLPPDSPGAFWGSSVASSPAIDAAPQQRMSQEVAPDEGSDLLSTSPKVTPVEENLSFQARGGESVCFSYQMGQWHAEVSSQLGAFSRRAVLPVVCSQGTDVTSRLEVLSRYPSWQRQIHVLDRNVCPTLGEVVYVGELGLKGGSGGEASGRGEPQGEVSGPAEQGDGEQAVSSQTPSLAEQPATTRPQLATRASDFGLARRDQLAESKGPTQLELAQIEAKRLKEQIEKLYPKFSQTTGEADAQQLVEELITPLERLVELEVFWSEDSLGKACAQDYLVKLREGAKSRKLALDPAKDQQLIRLLERSYSSSLKQLVSATASSQSVQLIEVLAQLAALSSDQGGITQDLSHYTDAAILYQHILSICANYQDTLDSQEAAALQNAAYQGLAQLQASMLAQGVEETLPEDVATLQKRIAEDRSELEAFRADVKPRTTALINNLEAVLSDQESSDEAIQQAEEVYSQGSQALFGEIAQWMSKFLAKLYQESESALGPAPCKYTVMGLGSMALQQITPYSDLEFAILIGDAPDEDTAEEWRKYFRKLTHLVHLRVINLGETVVPFGKYKLSLDHLGKRGLNFDLGGKIPLGRRDKPHLKNPYELIQPVSGMVYYLHNEEDKMEHMDKLLPYILESTCYVHGDSSLYERYVAAKRAFLLESKGSSGRPEYQVRSLKKLLEGVVEMDYSNPAQSKPGRRLVGELEDFKPKFGDEDAGRLYDVKQEIYRLPDRLLYRLAMYYGILPTSGWDAVAKLQAQHIIGVGDEAQQAAHHLQYAVSFATMLRLQTYLHHGQQFEKATMLSSVSQEAEIRQAVQAAFTLPESSLQAGGSLFRYYYTALPLHSKMQEFFRKWDKEFLEQSDLESGLIASLESLGLTDELSSSWRDSKEETFFQAEPFYDSREETRVDIHRRLLQPKKVKDCYEEALATREQRYGPDRPEIAGTLNNLGTAWQVLGDACKAVSYKERALAIYEQAYQADPNHLDIAMALNNLGTAWRALGDARKVVSFYERALAIYEQAYEADPNHPDIAMTLNNLGAAWRALGDARKAVNFFERVLAIYKQVYKEAPNHPKIASTLNNLGAAWRALGNTRKAISFFERALAIREQVYGPNHPKIASALNNLGNAWRDLGDARQAVSFSQRALAIKEQVYKETPNHPKIASTLNNLGAAWRALGDARKAISFYERALAIEEQVYKEAPNHPDIAGNLNNLGNAWQALGNARKTVNYSERALAIYEQVYKEDPNHPDIAITLYNLGLAWSDLGDAHQAVSFLERALAIYEQVSKEAPNHPVMAATLHNLGNAWRDLGDARKAISFYERALAIEEQVYKEAPNHPDIAGTLNNLGNTWRDLGDARKAVSFYERVLAMREQVYQETPNHPEIAATLNNLGGAWRDLGDARKAVSFLERALAIFEQVYQATPNHPEIASTLNNLGIAWRDLGDARQAVSYYQRALAIKDQVYQATPNHPEIASTLNNLGNAWSDLGDTSKAVSVYERALAMYEQAHKETPNHPEIAKTLNNLGAAWRDLGDVHKAVGYLERALAIYEQVYKEDPNHPDIAGTLNNLGIAWRDLGDARKAVSFYERALAMKEQVYKKDLNHPEIASALNNLGIAWRDLGDARQAVSFLERALAMKEQVYKEDLNHPDIAATLNNLGNAWKDLGDARQAVSYYQRALAIKEQVYQETPNHPDIASTLNNLGTAWRALGDAKQAVSFYQRTLAIYKQSYQETPNHPNIASTLNNLGLVYGQNLSDYSKALEYFKQALKMQQALHGRNNANVAQSLNNVAIVYSNSGNHAQALKYYKQALEIRKVLHGRNHANVAQSLNNVGIAYRNLGNHTQALEYYQQALQMQKALHEGENHADVAQAFLAVGNTYGSLGRLEESIQSYEQALAVPTVSQALKASIGHNLGCRCHEASLAARQEGDEQQAQAYLEKATASFEQAVQASDAKKAGLYTEYGNFLLNTGQFTQAHDYLHQAIESGDDEPGLSYSLPEQPTVTPVLQAYISQEQKVSLRGIDYAYYLMVHYYEDFQEAGIAMDQTREAYLEAYQASLDQRSGQAGQEREDKAAYYLLGSLYEALGDHEAAAAAFARVQDGTEQEDTQAAASSA